MGLLTGKTAIITGAARGIGKAIALKFASEGANIAFTDLVIDENGQNTEKEIAAFGVKVKGYASNAANFEETEKVVNEIKEEFGSVDILVNNAGIMDDMAVLEFFRDNSCKSSAEFAASFLGREDFFGQNLNEIEGLTEAITAHLEDIHTLGMRAALCKTL